VGTTKPQQGGCMSVRGSTLYVGHVSHARLLPFRHSFRYRIFALLLDLDALPVSFMFSCNRFNILSFHDSDHGAGDGRPARDWAMQQLRAAGLSPDSYWTFKLLCFPRLWGFTFNPLAIYYCFDDMDNLQATICQVSNTFGERHSYILKNMREPNPLQARKVFHVSPFMPTDGQYRFRLPVPGAALNVMIKYLDSNGATRLIATQTGAAKTATSINLLRAVLGHPLMTLKVVAAIHWQALKLWRKGATFHRKPAPPAQAISVDKHFKTSDIA
jgi:uncharacterized protein